MSKLSNAKVFGGIGAILGLVGGFIPNAGPIISIVGLVLLFVAVKYIADETKDRAIFKNYMYSFIFSVVAIIVVFAIIAATIGAVGGFSFFSELESEEITDFDSFWDYFEEFIVGVIIALVVGWILLVIGAIYLRKSYNHIAKHTKVDLFKTTGAVYFIGAVTLIILVGALILLIARILEIVSFFSLPDKLPMAAETPKENEIVT